MVEWVVLLPHSTMGPILNLGYYLCGISVHVLSGSMLVSSGFLSFFSSPKYMPLDVNEYLNMSVQWTRIPSRVYSHITPRIPVTGSQSTATLTRRKWSLKINDE